MAMGKVQHRQLTKSEWEALRRTLVTAFRRSGVKREGEELLFDLLTKSEVIMLARRLLIAQHLLKGESFEEIARELHVGLPTVQSIDHWLEAKLPFYRRILRFEEDAGKKKRFPADPHSFRGLRARYPAHFALFNLLLGDPREVDQESLV